MQREGRIEIGLGHLHRHGDHDGQDGFGGGISNDMAAEHAVGGATTSYISIVPTGELIGDVGGRVTKP